MNPAAPSPAPAARNWRRLGPCRCPGSSGRMVIAEERAANIATPSGDNALLFARYAHPGQLASGTFRAHVRRTGEPYRRVMSPFPPGPARSVPCSPPDALRPRARTACVVSEKADGLAGNTGAGRDRCVAAGQIPAAATAGNDTGRRADVPLAAGRSAPFRPNGRWLPPAPGRLRGCARVRRCGDHSAASGVAPSRIRAGGRARRNRPPPWPPASRR